MISHEGEPTTHAQADSRRPQAPRAEAASAAADRPGRQAPARRHHRSAREDALSSSLVKRYLRAAAALSALNDAYQRAKINQFEHLQKLSGARAGAAQRLIRDNANPFSAKVKVIVHRRT